MIPTAEDNNNTKLLTHSITHNEILNIVRKYVPDVTNVKDISMFTSVFTPRWVNRTACYERLEFLGDSVLSMALSAYLYHRYPNEDEGFLSTVRSRIVCGASLSELAAQHTPFKSFIDRIAKNQCCYYGNTANANTNANVACTTVSAKAYARVLEDVFEAFLGAMFIDMGYSIAEKWIINFIETHVDFAAIILSKTSAKSELCRFYIKQYGYMPTFYNENMESTVRSTIRNIEHAIIGTGIGANKSEAENAAARAALKGLGV